MLIFLHSLHSGLAESPAIKKQEGLEQQNHVDQTGTKSSDSKRPSQGSSTGKESTKGACEPDQETQTKNAETNNENDSQLPRPRS